MNMKECTIIVKKVYETKKSRTVTEKTVILSREAIEELSVFVGNYLDAVKSTSLSLLFNAINGL